MVPSIGMFASGTQKYTEGKGKQVQGQQVSPESHRKRVGHPRWRVAARGEVVRHDERACGQTVDVGASGRGLRMWSGIGGDSVLQVEAPSSLGAKRGAGDEGRGSDAYPSPCIVTEGK